MKYIKKILIKKKFFDEIGGFDKDLFMYFEDNDLCDKTIEKNKSIIEIPESKMIHLQCLSLDSSFLQNCKLSIIHKISEYIYYKKKYENTFIKCSLSFNTKQNHPLFAKNQKVIFLASVSFIWLSESCLVDSGS